MFFPLQRQHSYPASITKPNEVIHQGKHTVINITSSESYDIIILPEDKSEDYDNWKKGLLDRKNKKFKIRGVITKSLNSHFISGHIIMNEYLDNGFIMEDGFVIVNKNDHMETYNPSIRDTIQFGLLIFRRKLNEFSSYFKRKVSKKKKDQSTQTYTRFNNSELYNHQSI